MTDITAADASIIRSRVPVPDWFRAVSSLLMMALPLAAAHAEPFVVKDGLPQAEIVIASDPPRSTRLAAQELQAYVEKITGAKLNVVSEPTGTFPVRVHVVRVSSHPVDQHLTGRNMTVLEQRKERIVARRHRPARAAERVCRRLEPLQKPRANQSSELQLVLGDGLVESIPRRRIASEGQHRRVTCS